MTPKPTKPSKERVRKQRCPVCEKKHDLKFRCNPKTNMERRKVRFTKNELKILAIDYKSLLDVDLIMKRTISGKDVLAVWKMLSDADKLRLSIFEKIKVYLPRTKKQIPIAKP